MEEENKKINAYIYCRKSPDDKEDTKTSIINQEKLCRRVCEGEDWIVEKVFVDEQISGSDRERKGFNEMITSLFSSEVSIVVVKEHERFARDTPYLLDTLKKMKNRDKKLYSALHKKFIDRDDLGDIFGGVIAEKYITDQRLKALNVLEQKKIEGKPIGNPIFGYKYNYKFSSSGVKVPIDKNLGIDEWIIDLKESEIVSSVVQDYLNKRDYKATMKDCKINKSKYYRIIKNAKRGLYSGLVVYTRKYKDPDGSIAKTEEIKYFCRQKQIITEELWRKVNG